MTVVSFSCRDQRLYWLARAKSFDYFSLSLINVVRTLGPWIFRAAGVGPQAHFPKIDWRRRAGLRWWRRTSGLPWAEDSRYEAVVKLKEKRMLDGRCVWRRMETRAAVSSNCGAIQFSNSASLVVDAASFGKAGGRSLVPEAMTPRRISTPLPACTLVAIHAPWNANYTGGSNGGLPTGTAIHTDPAGVRRGAAETSFRISMHPSPYACRSYEGSGGETARASLAGSEGSWCIVDFAVGRRERRIRCPYHRWLSYLPMQRFHQHPPSIIHIVFGGRSTDLLRSGVGGAWKGSG